MASWWIRDRGSMYIQYQIPPYTVSVVQYLVPLMANVAVTFAVYPSFIFGDSEMTKESCVLPFAPLE